MTDRGTDSEGTPVEAGTGGRRQGRRGSWPRWVAAGSSVLVLAAAGTGWLAYRQLNGNIRTDVSAAEELRHHEAERPEPPEGEALNILLLGSDTRGNGNGRYGRDRGTQRADTVILFHISGDHSRATGLFLPRDLMVTVPRCTKQDGSRTPERLAQFNSAFETGGSACTIRTVEKLTGIRIDHHLVVDFTGFKRMVDAVGGVEVCVPHDVHDEQAGLDLRAGRQTLRGEDALGYVRARHGLGDGSDTGRISRQQQFLDSLVEKLLSNGVLLNPAKVYPVLDAATSSLTADMGLDSLTELYELVRTVRKIPENNVRFLTVPRQPYELDINRDELMQPQADELFAKLRDDRAPQGEGHPTHRNEADFTPVTETPQDPADAYRNTGEPAPPTGGNAPENTDHAPSGAGTAGETCPAKEVENGVN